MAQITRYDELANLPFPNAYPRGGPPHGSLHCSAQIVISCTSLPPQIPMFSKPSVPAGSAWTRVSVKEERCNRTFRRFLE